MPKQRYQQGAPTHAWQQIRPLLNDPAHITYEMLRHVIIWGEARHPSVLPLMEMSKP
jgi:hypothetical protein